MNPIKLFTYMISWMYIKYRNLKWELQADYIKFTKRDQIRWNSYD